MPQGTPGRRWGFDQGAGQMYPKFPPGTDEMFKQPHPGAGTVRYILRDFVHWIGQGYTRRSQCRLMLVNVTHPRTRNPPRGQPIPTDG